MKKILVGFLLVIIIAASSWALFKPEFFRIHDYIHAARVIEMFRALQDGQFPVRWSDNFGYGYGMPLFEFYAPLPYYVGATLHWLGFEVLTAVKLIFLISSIFTAWGSFKLGQKFYGQGGAVLTAAAITLAPYRAVNLFVRGAVSEAWGIMAMPWILLGLMQIIQHQKKGWRNLALALVVLMLSHNIMTMLFLPFCALFGVLYLGYQKWVVHKNYRNELDTLLEMSGSILLAIGLSSFYLFPALVEKNLTKVGDIFAGYFHYSHHFLYIRQFFQVNWGYEGSAWGPNDGISFFLGWGQLISLGLLIVLLLIRIWKKKNLAKLIIDRKLLFSVLLGLLLGLSLFMSILKSKPLWDALPVLSYAQFPWRFLGVGIIFMGLLVGMSVNLIENKFWKKLISIGVFIVLLFNARFFQPKEFLSDANEFYYTQEDLIQREMSGVLPDYIPAQMEDKLVPPQSLAWYGVDETENIKVIVDSSHQNLIETNFTQAKMVEFAIADFPGWKVELDGQEVDKNITERGNISFLVPAGHHRIGALFTQSKIRFWSDLLSAISLLVFVYFSLEIKDNKENT